MKVVAASQAQHLPPLQRDDYPTPRSKLMEKPVRSPNTTPSPNSLAAHCRIQNCGVQNRGAGPDLIPLTPLVRTFTFWFHDSPLHQTRMKRPE
eukprot:3391484-Rhodomonas_salina.2